MEIKVYLVEKLQIIREGFKSLLKEEPSIKIIAEAVTLPLCDKVMLDSSDVIMVECQSPHEEFFKQIRKIKEDCPTVKILVFTDEEDNLEMLQKLLEIGVAGYLTKNASKEELFHSIRKIHESGIYICTAFILRILKNPEHIPVKPNNITLDLKPSEIEVLKLIADGLTNNDIAIQLSTSVRTIEAWRKKILEKTNTTNTATLIKFAVKHGIIS